MKTLPHLIGQLYNTPLMLTLDKAEELHMAMNLALSGGLPTKAMSDGFAPSAGPAGERKPYAMAGNGVAIIPVMGPLLQRGGWMDALCGMTSYDRVAALVDSAMRDRDVNAVLLEVDSPGGSVAGLFTLTARLKAMGEQKPIWTYANEGAFSAAYAIAGATQKIYLPSTAMVGSIGVIAMHVDQSQRDKAQGLSYTPIFAGDKKAAGNSHSPLDDATRADMQREVGRLYGMFVDHVAEGRQLDRQAVIDTQAGLLNADDAVTGRFADGIASIEETVQMLSDAAKPQSVVFNLKGNSMSQPENTVTAAQLASAEQAAAASAKTAERSRISAILDLPQAQGREALARKLAMTTDMPADAVAGLLEVAPAAAVTPATPAANSGKPDFAAAMADLGNPAVGAGGGDASAATTAEAMAKQILTAGV
ncbi:S49 family peptidase [Deefgea piscis]|uniref:S49 family peptidase n=1 Tax=Deefgea piscis TaxID=2739061 RepID=A0A6M8SS60_9NEIS|nr:S49 family peptidase [Deefgea piscis]QKJ68035.1 S49 family peptidase [Deefgea piscis]